MSNNRTHAAVGVNRHIELVHRFNIVDAFLTRQLCEYRTKHHASVLTTTYSVHKLGKLMVGTTYDIANNRFAMERVSVLLPDAAEYEKIYHFGTTQDDNTTLVNRMTDHDKFFAARVMRDYQIALGNIPAPVYPHVL